MYQFAELYEITPILLTFASTSCVVMSAFLTNESFNVIVQPRKRLFPFEGFPRDKLVSSTQQCTFKVIPIFLDWLRTGSGA